MKKYRFWYHYNKPMSKKCGYPILTVHYRGRCLYATRIVCKVPTETHKRERQPRMVVRGWATVIGHNSPDDDDNKWDIWNNFPNFGKVLSSRIGWEFVIE